MSTDKATAFPNRTGGYFEKYVAIKRALDQHYFSVANAGLALTGERYTRHDLRHVEDVILTAGNMLGYGIGTPIETAASLDPFEVYVLLVAILLHDAGNASGREGHERRAGRILKELGPTVDLEPLESRLVSSIAQAHGGRSPAGDRDTIRRLNQKEQFMQLPVHAQRLAAVLRLADEFSENPRRADDGALRGDAGAPAESVVHNLFCKVVNISFDRPGHSITLNLSVERQFLGREYILKQDGVTREILLIDYIRERLEKADMERRYCNRFLSGWAQYDRIRVKLEVLDDDHEAVEVITFDLEDTGYPATGPDWSQLAPGLNGAILRSKHETTP